MLRERSHIAQFDTPEAILTRPADDFVSGFVGAGAALKRLNLTRVRDVEIAGSPRSPWTSRSRCVLDRLRAGRHSELLLLDRQRRPYKWLRRGDLMRAKGSPARAGTLVHDTVTGDATLRDALEAVLTDSGGRVAVTGRRRRVRRRGGHGDAGELGARDAGGRPADRGRARARPEGAPGGEPRP